MSLNLSIILMVLTLQGVCGNLFVMTPNDTLVMIGDSTQLNCSSVVSGFAAWYKGELGKGQEAISLGNKVVGNNSQYEIIGDKENNRYDLRIRNVTMKNEDNYECGNQIFIDERASAHLYVVGGLPRCSVEPFNILYVGRNATLTCTIDLNGNAPGELVWYKNGNEIHRERGGQSKVNLIVDKSDNWAEYYCKLQHSSLPSWKGPDLRCKEKVIMEVEYSSQLTMSVTPNATITEQDDVFINCEAIGGNPGPYIMMMLRDEDVIISCHASNIQHKISNISRSDSGVYKCKTFTKFHDADEVFLSREKRIKVHYPPTLNETHQTKFAVSPSNDVALVCKVNGYPTPKIQWFDMSGGTIPGDEESRNITTVHDEAMTTSTLRVVILDKSYYGVYICEASNGITPSAKKTMEIVQINKSTIYYKEALTVTFLCIGTVLIIFLSVCLHRRCSVCHLPPFTIFGLNCECWGAKNVEANNVSQEKRKYKDSADHQQYHQNYEGSSLLPPSPTSVEDDHSGGNGMETSRSLFNLNATGMNKTQALEAKRTVSVDRESDDAADESHTGQKIEIQQHCTQLQGNGNTTERKRIRPSET